MRLNKFLSTNTELSRRKADDAIKNGRVTVNGRRAYLGLEINSSDIVSIDGQVISVTDTDRIIILLNKPVGYVCSRNGQGAQTVYDLLPIDYKDLKIAGRLDKDSSGLVVLTNDGNLLNELTHPSNKKQKIYEVTTDKKLWPEDKEKLLSGVDISDVRPSKFASINRLEEKTYKVVLSEGRNRQIRRSFEALGYKVEELHRTQLGRYSISNLKIGQYIIN